MNKEINPKIRAVGEFFFGICFSIISHFEKDYTIAFLELALSVVLIVLSVIDWRKVKWKKTGFISLLGLYR